MGMRRRDFLVAGATTVTAIGAAPWAFARQGADMFGLIGKMTAAPGKRDELAARGESPASHRDRRGAPMTRRDDREYREYLREEQRSQRGWIAGRMQSDFHHGLPGVCARNQIGPAGS